MSATSARPTCKVGLVHYPEKLRPRDELVRLAWLAHGGQLCLACKGRLGKYVDAILWGPASDIIKILPEPVSCRGAQKLWDVPAYVLERMRAQFRRVG